MHLARIAILALLALSGTASAQAPAPAPPSAAPVPPAPDGTNLPYLVDRSTRMTVPVMIDGAGPFPFVVDTGAERTVLATEIADRLGLPAGPTLTLATITGRHATRSARVASLAMASHKVRDLEAPMLAQYNLGAAGLIGIDSLSSSRVEFDFKAGELRVLRSRDRGTRDSRPDVSPVNEIVVMARRKAGRLILSNALVDGVRVDVIIDTGAQTSIGNRALRDRKLKRGGTIRQLEIHSVTGEKLMAEASALHRIKLGGVEITELPVAYADSYAFTALGLDRKPALLLGMDALALFDGIEIDFARRQVVFSLPRGGRRDQPARFVATETVPATRPAASPAG